MNETQIKYWTNIYNNKKPPMNSSKFCDFIMKHDLFSDSNLSLLDCGCGNGRDSYMLAQKFNRVVGIDVSSNPDDKKNCTFEKKDFCTYNKSGFDVIYSRFTFHSISDQQQIEFLKSIHSNSYLCIETRSTKSKDIKKVFGDDHYRNYSDYSYVLKILRSHGFKILFSAEKKGFAPYKTEDPVCIRIICKKE